MTNMAVLNGRTLLRMAKEKMVLLEFRRKICSLYTENFIDVRHKNFLFSIAQ